MITNFFSRFREAFKLFTTKKGEYVSGLGEEAILGQINYCANELNESLPQDTPIYLLYSGFVNDQIGDYFKTYAEQVKNCYQLSVGQDIAVYGIVKKDSKYIFCETVTYSYNMIRGNFMKVDNWPPFMIYEVDWREQRKQRKDK